MEAQRLGPGPRAAGCSGYGRLVDQVKYIRNNYFPTGRPPILYPKAELRLMFFPEAPRPPRRPFWWNLIPKRGSPSNIRRPDAKLLG